ncbi:sodium:calcium antiporter [Candidatus Woesearchaeota archaeon]|nr:sodium:calcium antiporter [Candidatus Woesearchaeota archaeon]
MALANFIAANPLIFHILIGIASFTIMVKSADMIVYGIDRYAKKTGLSNYVIGLLVISITASVPEFVAAITGLLAGDEGIVFGTILGSNLTGITLVSGVLALVGRKLKLVNKVLAKMEVALFFMIMLPFVLGADGSLSRYDGLILSVVYIIYAVKIWKREEETGHVRKSVKFKFLWKNMLIFLLALAALFLSSRWLVFSSISVSKILNIPTYIMAILILGIASSLPDMLVGIRSILEGEAGLGLGNTLGSITVKSLLFLGVFAMIRPLSVDFSTIGIAVLATIFCLAFMLYLSEKGEINWKHGLVLLFLYIAYISVELIRGLA